MTEESNVGFDLDVFRSDPERGTPPRYQRYHLDLPAHTPVLTALLKVRAEIDPSLTLRYSCRSAICGSCAMVINSKSRLACQTPIGPEIEAHGRIVVDPMRNQPVLRDLVVDQTKFWGNYRKLEPHLIPDPERPMTEGVASSMSPAQVEKFKETPRCIACAACYSACPMVEADPSFPGPMALAKLYRFVVDPRDGATKARLVQIQPDGLWLCLRCHLCTEACPKDVRPSERIMDLKEMALAVQGSTEAGSRHALAFKDNIRERGLLNERKLVTQTYTLPELIGHVPYGLRVARKKPETLRTPPKIEGQAEVERLYEILDDPKGSP
ncbi:MAG: 2Fe-2S iron-sulfur cluster-binding protein [Thermoplasmata archaeon]|nr:2Fe-2S iron-sulfur cluster-binding protein [Thermoplasmata archaeon]